MHTPATRPPTATPSAAKPPLPVCCSPHAYRLLRQHARTIASPDALLGIAVAIAVHGTGGTEVAAVDAEIQAMADTVRSRVAGRSPRAILSHLHAYLFDECGFRVNAETYDDPADSYLPAVLANRRGLPILLGLVYRLVGERLGLRVDGIGLPGHFVVGVTTGSDRMIVDPFHGGRVLDRDDCEALIARSTGVREPLDPDWLRPVSNLHWLTRMLQNLLHTFNAADQYGDLAAVIEMQMVLWPGETQLQRDLALVLARLGLPQPAGAWLGSYLRHHPADPQRHDLQQLLDVLTS